jgi:hypothetical protein
VNSQRKNLSPIRVAELFGIASGNQGSSERERRIACKKVLREFRFQWQRLGRGEITRIDPLLAQYINNWGYRIFSNPKPISALEQFLGAREKRGKRAKNVERDFQIAVAVVEKRKSGMTLEGASEAVASEFAAKNIALEVESITKIYKRNHIEAKAHIAMCALEGK